MRARAGSQAPSVDLRDPPLARHPAGDRRGLLRPLRLDRGARHHPGPERRPQLHRHRLPARHPHPLAAGHQRCERCADADRHGRELRHRHRRCADAHHRCVTERRVGLGTRGRRGERRGLRAGDHGRPAGCEPVPRTAALHEQRRHRSCRRLRLLQESISKPTSDHASGGHTGDAVTAAVASPLTGGLHRCPLRTMAAAPRFCRTPTSR